MKELLKKYPTAKVVKNWTELIEFCKNNPSETHVFEYCRNNGWLKPKDGSHRGHYMTTHTFYGSNFDNSTVRFQGCGFNVIIDNWDEGRNE